jgi:hypothetical protein
MKRSVRIFGVLLLIAVSLSGCHRSNREKQARKESKRIDRVSSNHGRQNGMNHRSDPYMMRGMKQDQGRMANMGRRNQMGQGQMGMRSGMGNTMRRGSMMSQDSAGMMQMRRGAGMGMGQMSSMDNNPVGPGGIFIENIPNVTDKQRKEFDELLKKQKEEMTKMRAEMAAKIRSTIESQRSKMLNIFTAEQKKAIGAR